MDTPTCGIPQSKLLFTWSLPRVVYHNFLLFTWTLPRVAYHNSHSLFVSAFFREVFRILWYNSCKEVSPLRDRNKMASSETTARNRTWTWCIVNVSSVLPLDYSSWFGFGHFVTIPHQWYPPALNRPKISFVNNRKLWQATRGGDHVNNSLDCGMPHVGVST